MPAESKREPFPTWLEPMLLSSGPLPGNGSDWTYELKWDGMRRQAAIPRGRVRVRSRARRDWTEEFPELLGLAPQSGRGREVILDGELVCLDAAGRPDFGRLRSRLVTRLAPASLPG